MSLLEVQGVHKTFRSLGKEPVKALDDVSLSLDEGSTIGLVGESGSGKSTLIRCLLRLDTPDSGSIRYDGQEVHRLRGSDLRQFRREVQMVFQDPHSSLNPRMTVEQLVSEGMVIHGLERRGGARRARVRELMSLVGLESVDITRYPNSFSGGQRQRIAIARALAVRPRLLVCDEPVSALDVSVRAQIINLLMQMQAQLGLTVFFIAHDLAVVRHLCPWIAVIQSGHIVDNGSREGVFTRPTSGYTRALLDAVPIPDPVAARERLRGHTREEEHDAHRS